MKLTEEIYKGSLEARWRRGNFWRLSALTALSVLFTAGFAVYYRSKISSLLFPLLLLAAVTLVFAVMAAVSIASYRSDLKHAEDFVIYEATLSRPAFGLGFQKRARYFTADFEISDGEKRSVETVSMWSSSILSSFYFGDYCNKKVRIAYSITGGKVIVLDKIDQI